MFGPGDEKGGRVVIDTPDSFRQLFANQGIVDVAAADHAYADLSERYGELHRAYHTLPHVHAMLRLLDGRPFDADDQNALKWAIWYHDAVYDPQASDNEERSADLFADVAGATRMPAEFADRVRRLILVTKTHMPETQDERVMVDLDLAILGEEVVQFDTYEAAIRYEYSHVPDGQFAAGRTKVLLSFLERPRIYSSPLMDDYEARARVNLVRSIAHWNVPQR
jgi:predicted metal-dependent HD superfamily phosphohydrolase